MAIFTFDKVKTQQLGFSNKVNCPECKENICFPLFKSHDFSPIASLKKNENLCFTVCPKCASVFSVNSNYINERENGTLCAMTESDLKLMVKKQ